MEKDLFKEACSDIHRILTTSGGKAVRSSCSGFRVNFTSCTWMIAVSGEQGLSDQLPFADRNIAQRAGSEQLLDL
jgi:hypothetical protein